ncbi:MAG: M20/M25/M40 family metallo-hydrolase, partial [Candidatus Thermoplasmatota archaeon]
FDTEYIIGQRIGIHQDWYDNGTGPVVTSEIGLIGSNGLAPANSTFIWIAHPFTWMDPDFESIILQIDFETDQFGFFDNNRIGWMITNTNTNTDNFFGVQLTNNGSRNRIEGYWDHDIGINTDKRPVIDNISTELVSDSWYRVNVEVTKLTATSARIDVTLVSLDVLGYPIANIASGSIIDTSSLGANTPDPEYFTAPIWPAFNNNQTADNANVYVSPGLPQYTLNVIATPADAGWVSIIPAGGTYDYGTTVSVTAESEPHWHFIRWEGTVPTGHEYDNPLRLEMFDNKSLTAVFTINSYTLTTLHIGNGSVLLTPSGGVYEYNTIVNATAIPDPGWAFAGWTGDIIFGHGYDNPVSITIDEDKTITAIFKQPNPQILDILSNVNESLYLSYLQDLVEFGVRVTGSTSCHSAETWLFNEFQSMGLAVQYHNWSNGGYTDKNVIATLPGSDPTSTKIYILCSHIDTVPTSPGADDDGSGVALMMTAAKLLSQYHFNHTIRFIGFTGEEEHLLGSTVYAGQAAANGDNIQAVINTDTIGHIENESDYNKLKLYDNPPSEWLTAYADMIKNTYNDTIQLIIIKEHFESYETDLQPFWDNGYNGFHSVEPYVNYSIIHGPNDLIEHMNISYCLKTTRLEIAMLVELAELIGPYNLTLTTSGTGSGSIQANLTGTFYYGDTVTIWANASVGSTFAGFSGSLSGTTTPQILFVNGDEQINALFNINQYSLATDTTGSGDILLTPPGGIYDYNIIVSAQATPGTGYIFTQWTGDVPSGHNFDNPLNLTMDANKTLTAVFTNTPPIVSDIPNQTIPEGSTFTTIALDDYVTDLEDQDANITWTYAGNTQVTVNIENRIATIITPNENWNGIETITFTATDTGGASDADPATFTVTAVNDPPTAYNDTANTNSNTSIEINILANDIDIDDTINPETVIIITPATNGTTSINATTGAVTYTPNIGFTGSDIFTYTVQDNQGATSNIATVSITVNNL